MTPATHNQAALHQEFYRLIDHPEFHSERLEELAQMIEAPHKCLGAMTSPILCCLIPDVGGKEFSNEKVSLLRQLLPKSEPVAQERYDNDLPWIVRACAANFLKINTAIDNSTWSKMDMGKHFVPFIDQLDKGSPFYARSLGVALKQNVSIQNLHEEICEMAACESINFIEQIFDWENPDLRQDIFQQLTAQGYDLNTLESHQFSCEEYEGIAFLEAEKIFNHEQSIQITPLACATVYGDASTFVELIKMGANADPDAKQVVFEEGVEWTMPKLLEYWNATNSHRADHITAAYQSHLAASAAQQAMQDILSSTAPKP